LTSANINPMTFQRWQITKIFLIINTFWEWWTQLLRRTINDATTTRNSITSKPTIK
jgi:hypothetical protein